jgi:RNA polymerase sigma-70 factor, ECF subfamily
MPDGGNDMSASGRSSHPAHSASAPPPVGREAPIVGAQRDIEDAERDALLMQRIRRAKLRPGGLGDDDAKAALATLVTRYQDRLYAICLRMLGGADREAAADLTQESLLKIIQGIESYDGRSRLSTWLIRVTMNTCLSHLRSSKVRRAASLEAVRASAGETSSVRFSDGRERRGELSGADRVEQTESRRRVAAALAGLDSEQRAVLVLRDVQGLEYDHIADVLQVPVGTVKSRLFRARLALRDAIDPPADHVPKA